MTRRAVLVGLLGAVALCGVGFFNDRVIRQTFIIGNHMPISVYGLLVVFLLAVNPLAFRLARRAAFTGRELAVILAIVLPACYIPGRGFVHIFTSVVMMPRHYERADAGWKRYDVVRMAPDVMLAGADPEFSAADITRPGEICRLLGAPPDFSFAEPEPSAAALRIRARMPAEARARLRDALGAGDAGGLGREVARSLNALLEAPDLYDEPSFPRAGLPQEAAELLQRESGELSARDLRRLNRHLVDSAFPGSVRSLSSKEDYAITGFVQGLGVASKRMGVSEVPWYAWRRTLFCFWFPMVLCLSFSVMGLALVTHRQWSDHEHLPYPIVTFANSLLPQEGQSRGSVFTSKAFLIAAGTILLIHMNNYAYRWWPQNLVEFPRSFDFRSLLPLFPALRRGGGWAIMNPTIYFAAVGFAYFVTTDVSFSLGIAPFVYSTVVGTFAGYGISLRGGGHISEKVEGFLYGGSHFGMFLVILYTGRRYFSSVFRRCFCLRAPDEVEPSAVWGARVFLVSTLLFIVQLVLVGLEWQWAVLYTAITLMLFIVMTRVVAEAGTFFIHPYAYPGVLLWGFLGAKALGPRNMLIMFIVTTVLVIDPREAVMPFVTHALKFADGRGVKLGRTALAGAVALALGLAVAVPVALYLQYERGAVATGDWWTQHDPKFSYDAVVKVQDRLAAQGSLEEARDSRGLARLRHIAPSWAGVAAFVIAAGLVLAFTAARLRFPKWPFHPVMFIVLGTFASRMLAVSFLIGCLVKFLATKYGGASAYRRLKPVMIGIIAGDMLGGLIPMIIGAVYYFATGEIPKSFSVLPL